MSRSDVGRQRAYLQEMARRRGYVLDYHKVLVAEDLPFMKAVNDLLAISYTNNRRLDRKTKELISVAVHTALGSGQGHIAAHIEVAKRHGATKVEVLEVLEVLALAAGLPRFMGGLAAWMECFPVARVELERPATGRGGRRASRSRTSARR
ncbi:MAG: carboxymuconolactone decarboxylase family protein [Candidatus Rokubacteria bacterium]|nr:carboxymuconolactone decarboxylase family protein [Candidatus Rokubacteria bacterium]